ncbi:MAG: hypothetical protein IPF92_05200 [Myxococcales bacterium]|nr:hypothetical protein [Myxococcales bacterium]
MRRKKAMARTGTLYTGSEAWFAPTRPLAARAAGGVLVGALALGCKKAPPPPPAPRAIPTPPERAIYVTNNGSDSLSVIDRDGVTVTNVPLDIDPDAREAPHHLGQAPGGDMFVALAFPPEGASPTKKKPHAGHGVSTSPGRLARLLPGSLTVRATRDVDENPGDVVVSHDGKSVLVTHFDMKRAMTVAAAGNASPATMFARLQVWSAASLELRAQRPLCVAPHGMALTRDDRTALVACYGSDELAAVDLTSPTLPTARYPLGGTPGVPGVPRYGPYSVTMVGDDSALVASLEGNDLRVFDLRARAFVASRTVPMGAKVFMPAVQGTTVAYVPLQAPDSLARVDLAAGKVTAQVVKPIDECRAPHAFALAGDRPFVVCEGDHKTPGTVLEIDPNTLATLRRWTVGVNPDGLLVGQAGGNPTP